jgi:RNA polymerase sigma-70 factor (ECF subfamily)
MPREQDDGRWLRLHAAGDAGAFARLLEAFRAPVYGFLVRSGVGADNRDDLFQEVFLKVHAAADRYDPARPLAPWIFTIAANIVRSHFRRRDARPGLVLDDGGALPSGEPDPERAASARQTVEWLEVALTELPRAQREVILLAAVQGLAQDEVARALGMPVNTVKTHLRRARLALARKLQQRNTVPTEGTESC